MVIRKYKKTYAEKLLMLYEGQTAAMHFHMNKMEDTINRGGNDVYITVYNGTSDGRMLDTDVEVNFDGMVCQVTAGTKVKLSPGQSITITPYMYHDFMVPDKGGSVLLGEVSMCNDDDKDNNFYNKEIGRFPSVEEDEEPYRILCNEYPSAELTGKAFHIPLYCVRTDAFPLRKSRYKGPAEKRGRIIYVNFTCC